MERTELEKSLVAFAQANALSTITIGFRRHESGREWFNATAHWNKAPTESGLGCVIAHGDTLDQAISNAKAQIADQRAVTIADEAIPMGEAA